ncbi:MAG: peptidylprolyl isomerase [Pseudomonadota bacterium]|nr:peptidylprolyl isomerase [Pseudomonadota bacterium]
MFAATTNAQTTDPAPSASSGASAGGDVTVNGHAIPASLVDMIAKAQTAGGAPDSPGMRTDIRDQLINLQVIADEAVRLGLDKQPDTAAQLEVQRNQTLARAFQQHYTKSTQVDDAVLKAEYEKVRSGMGENEYKAQHVLVKTEDEAKKIIADLDKGGDFDKIAAEQSLDTGSKEGGGHLDWAAPQSYVKPFSEAMVALKKGQYTKTPVQTQFGWHVIKLEDERALKAPSFDEVKDNLRQSHLQQDFGAVVRDLRSKAKITGL